MKKASLLILSAFLTINGVSAQSEKVVIGSITTVNGQVFNRVEVLKRDPDGLMFRHEKGMAKIPFSELPAEIQTQFNYKAEEAAAFVKEHEEAAKAARAKAAEARAEARDRRAQEKALKLQIELLRQQAALSASASGFVIPGFADFGVPTWGYGLGLGLDPDLFPGEGGGKRAAKRRFQWNQDRLFGDFSTTKYIGPNAALYGDGVTNTNVRSFLTFGGYSYPTELATRAGHPLVGLPSGKMGYRPTMAPGHRPVVRPMPGQAHRRLVPANSAGARIGGTGTLIQGGANRISHR